MFEMSRCKFNIHLTSKHDKILFYYLHLIWMEDHQDICLDNFNYEDFIRTKEVLPSVTV